MTILLKFPGTNLPKYSFPKNPGQLQKPEYSPGPGSYETFQSIGKQVLSTKSTVENPFIPSAPRTGIYDSPTTDVGPGDYGRPPAACDEQKESTKQTCVRTKFGTGYKKLKENMQKVDLSEPHPGPGSYKITGDVGSTSVVYRNAPKASLSGRTSFGSPWGTA